MRLLDSEVTTCHPWPLVKSQSHHLLPPWAVTGRGTARAPSALWDGNLRWPCVHIFSYWTSPAGAAPLEFSPARITSHNAKQNWADRKTTTCSDMSKISMKSSHMDDLSRCKDANCRTGNGMICADVCSPLTVHSKVRGKAFFSKREPLGQGLGSNAFWSASTTRYYLLRFFYLGCLSVDVVAEVCEVVELIQLLPVEVLIHGTFSWKHKKGLSRVSSPSGGSLS